MPVIHLTTIISAEIEICFDLSRSIDLHQISTSQTNEKAIAGRIKGLINLNETVTWEATHFGLKQQLTSKITAFNKPYHFRDEQVKGAFKYFIHDHNFEVVEKKVFMKDRFEFESPFGLFGQLFNALILNAYMRKLLITRNKIIKEFAETEKWRVALCRN